MPAAYAPFTGVAGVAFGPDEAPTTAGETYWLVYERTGGFNAFRMNEGDSYPGGTSAFFDGTAWQTQPFDLHVNLYEYAPAPPPPFVNLLRNYSFEESLGTSHPGWTNNTRFGSNGLFPNPGGAVLGGRWASYSYGDGGSSAQELYQTVDVTPGQIYLLGTASYLGGTNGTATARLLWADGDYPGLGSGTELSSRTWSHPGGFLGWDLMAGFVIPTSTRLTFILRAEITGWGGGVHFDPAGLIQLMF